jgi:ATP-binding cassette subfamily C protein
MSSAFHLGSGAPVLLPEGDAPWRVREGIVEVYLTSPDRRRLVAVVPAGHHLFPLPSDAASQLALVAPGGAYMTPASEQDADLRESAAAWVESARGRVGAADAVQGMPRPDDGGAIVAFVQRFTADLDRRHAARQAEQDREEIARLASRGSKRGASPGDSEDMRSALTAVGAALGAAVRDARGFATASDVFSDVPQRARLMGFFARRVVLFDGWWKNDLGPLIARRTDDGRIAPLVWSRGAYVAADGMRVGPEGGNDYGDVVYVGHSAFPERLGGLVGLARYLLAGIGTDARAIALAGLAAALIGLALPLGAAWAFTDVVPAGASGLLASVGIALALCAVAQFLLHATQAWAAARIEGRSAVRLAAGLTGRVLQLPARFFKTIAAGDLNQRLQSVEALRALAIDVLLSSGVTAVFSVVYLAMMFAYDVKLGLLATVPALIYVAALVVSRLMQIAPLREAAEIDGRLAGITHETLEAIAKLRTAAAELRAMARWRALYERERVVAARGARVANRFGAFADAWQIVTLATLFAVAGLLSAEDLPPGMFIGFLAAFGIFQGSLVSFCDALMRVLVAQPLAERVRPILAAEPEAATGRAAPGLLTGMIEANSVSFGYSADGPPLIDGLEFRLNAGEHMAIVGGSGSGKSTILRLLLGFERPRTGVILYDGQNLAGLDLSSVRSQIGVVLQSSSLFSGTILENIRGAAEVSLEDCLLAADRAGLGPDLELLPMGVHTPITDGAGTFSGGQRQRILIARAIAARPRILFLDEATSALDNVVQAHVSETIDAMHVTRITIAHRLSTVRKADRICVVKNGRFAETGTFEELIAVRGLFAELAQRQMLDD